jgi:hypothetical protein
MVNNESCSCILSLNNTAIMRLVMARQGPLLLLQWTT